MSRGRQTRTAAGMLMWLSGSRSGVWWLAAWTAATVVWGVAAEAPAQRQSLSEESKACEAGAARPGRGADAGQRDAVLFGHRHPSTLDCVARCSGLNCEQWISLTTDVAKFLDIHGRTLSVRNVSK